MRLEMFGRDSGGLERGMIASELGVFEWNGE